MVESKTDQLHEDPVDPLAKSIVNGQATTEDAVFGDITAEGPNYRSVSDSNMLIILSLSESSGITRSRSDGSAPSSS
jgi:hypothetical protein